MTLRVFPTNWRDLFMNRRGSRSQKIPSLSSTGVTRPRFAFVGMRRCRTVTSSPVSARCSACKAQMPSMKSEGHLIGATAQAVLTLRCLGEIRTKGICAATTNGVWRSPPVVPRGSGPDRRGSRSAQFRIRCANRRLMGHEDPVLLLSGLGTRPSPRGIAASRP
jgi:hypothetical protein